MFPQILHFLLSFLTFSSNCLPYTLYYFHLYFHCTSKRVRERHTARIGALATNSGRDKEKIGYVPRGKIGMQASGLTSAGTDKMNERVERESSTEHEAE